MNPDRWRQVTALFHDALARDQTGRAAFLDTACRDDEIRADVEHLLAAHDRAGNFGDLPVVTDLGISPHTVKTHLERIFEKLGANDRAQAVAIAIRTGIVH